MIRILFLGGAKRVSMAKKFIEAAHTLGKQLKLYSYELSAYVPVAEVAEIIVGRRWTDPDILEHIHHIVEEKKIDIIIPFVDPAVEIAACVRDRYHDVWVPVGDTSTASVMFDKKAADAVFRREDLPVPDSGRYPLIAKPRFGSASKGLKILENARELEALGEDADNYLIQEYIANRREITVDCYVAMSGRIICAVPRLRLATQGGEATVTETIRDEKIEALAIQTLTKTGLKGAVTLQFISDTDTDRLMIMEINPRLGGGAVCAVHAGADIPLFILRDSLSMSLTPCTGWREHTLITRYFAEVAFELS